MSNHPYSPNSQSPTSQLIADMRKVGISDSHILALVELQAARSHAADQARLERQRELARLRKQRQRARQRPAYTKFHETEISNWPEGLEPMSRGPSVTPPNSPLERSPRPPKDNPPLTPHFSKPSLCRVIPLRTPIDENAEPTDEDRAAAKDKGLDNDTTKNEFKKFKNYNRIRGTMCADWRALWRQWLEHVKVPPKPVVQETDDERIHRIYLMLKAREAKEKVA